MQRGIFDNWGLKEHVGTIHYDEKKEEERNMKYLWKIILQKL